MAHKFNQPFCWVPQFALHQVLNNVQLTQVNPVLFFASTIHCMSLSFL